MATSVCLLSADDHLGKQQRCQLVTLDHPGLTYIFTMRAMLARY